MTSIKSTKELSIKVKNFIFPLASVLILTEVTHGSDKNVSNSGQSYFPKTHFTVKPDYTPPTPNWKVSPYGVGGLQGKYKIDETTISGGYHVPSRSGYVGASHESNGCNLF